MSYFFRTDLDLIRHRPGMYVGSFGRSALIYYVTGALTFHLGGNPSWVELSVAGEEFQASSDADMVIEQEVFGKIYPFETVRRIGDDIAPGYDGPILAALGNWLTVDAVSRGSHWSIAYRDGVRANVSTQRSEDCQPFVRLSFVPDRSLLQSEPLSPYFLHSYVKRLSYVNPGVRFTLTIDGRAEQFQSNKGIGDLFESMAAPYQLLHEPAHLRAFKGELEVELLFAFHRWKKDYLVSLVNGVAAEGGAHEDGLKAGLKAFRASMAEAADSKRIECGIIGLLSLQAPQAITKGREGTTLASPEIAANVERLVSEHALQWIKEHPQEEQHIRAYFPCWMPA